MTKAGTISGIPLIVQKVWRAEHIRGSDVNTRIGKTVMKKIAAVETEYVATPVETKTLLCLLISSLR